MKLSKAERKLNARVNGFAQLEGQIAQSSAAKKSARWHSGGYRKPGSMNLRKS